MRDSSRRRAYGFSAKCPAKFDRNAECAIVLAHSTNVVIHHAGVRREKDYRKRKGEKIKSLGSEGIVVATAIC